MKKFLLSLCILFILCGSSHAITTTAYVTSDDVTVTQLEQNRVLVDNAINSFDGNQIQDGSIDADALATSVDPETRWDEGFVDFVVSGLTIPTSASLSSTTTAGTAYINGKRISKDATANTYTASRHIYVDLSDAGTYTYSTVTINASEPSVTADSTRLARVSTDATTVLSVRDDRPVGVEPINDGVFVGSFTRDLSLSNGDQSITGVGFRPNAIIFIGGISGDDALGFGLSDGSTGGSIYDNSSLVGDTWGINSGNFGLAILINGAEARVTEITFDSDGFTLTWLKASGSPSGTATIKYIAFKQ